MVCTRVRVHANPTIPQPTLQNTHPHPQEDANESLCSLTFAQRVNGVSLSGAGAGGGGGGKGGKGGVDAKSQRQALLQARGEAREAEAARCVFMCWWLWWWGG